VPLGLQELHEILFLLDEELCFGFSILALAGLADSEAEGLDVGLNENPFLAHKLPRAVIKDSNITRLIAAVVSDQLSAI